MEHVMARLYRSPPRRVRYSGIFYIQRLGLVRLSEGRTIRFVKEMVAGRDTSLLSQKTFGFHSYISGKQQLRVQVVIPTFLSPI